MGAEKAFLVFSGGNDRAVLAFLRALGQCGRRAVIVARTLNDRILSTSYRRDVVYVRESHGLDLPVFTACLDRAREAAGGKALVVLPSSEYFNAFLLEHRPLVEAMGCEIPLVDARIYGLLTNKDSASAYFASRGISVPREIVNSTECVPPVVAKPRNNISPDGSSLYPHLLMDARQMAAFHTRHDASSYFFQEYLQGESLYLLFYVPRCGGEAFVWSQRNLLQQPNGKSMLWAEPADLHRSELATGLIDALREAGFWGLGMIELIRTSDRDVFIEMNPRIWGPMQLVVDQHQPLLEAMIGEALHGDPGYFLKTAPASIPRGRRGQYFWCGGLAHTLASHYQPSWHGPRRPLLATAFAGLRNDVYLRADSWRCFIREMTGALHLAWHRERTKD